MPSSVWKGQLTFGLVSLPVRLFRAARKERIRMHYVAPGPPREKAHDEAQAEEHDDERPLRPIRISPLQVIRPSRNNQAEEMETPVRALPTQPVSRARQTLVSGDSETPLRRQDLLKAHEVAPDQFVTFTQAELRVLRPETSAEMQIVRSVRLEEIDPVYFDTSYYVIADRGGERAYSLLFLALKETRYVALATVAMHGREHVVVIRPGVKGLLAHTMFYNDEIRAEDESEAATGSAAPKEVQLAKTFVEAIAGPFAPAEFKDTQREMLQELISGKLARDEVSRAAGAPQPLAQTVDIMEALRKSILKGPKLTESAEPVQKRVPGKVTRVERGSQKRKA